LNVSSRDSFRNPHAVRSDLPVHRAQLLQRLFVGLLHAPTFLYF